MNRFNTGNALPSISEEDMYDNCLSLDEAMNSTNPTWRDRFNVEKPTIDAALKSAGFMPAGFDFVTGGTLQPGDRNKAVYNPAPNGDNNWYRWNGVFPKEIAANSQPNPKDENNWVLAHFRIGIVEKEALRRTYLEAGYNLVDGSFEAGSTVTSVTDVLLYEATGIAYLWLGALPKVVPAGSTPASTGGIDLGAWVSAADSNGEERLLGVGAKIYRGSNGQYVQNGDTVPIGTTHLAVLINGKVETVAMSPVASGAVSLLTEVGATIGNSVVNFTQSSVPLYSNGGGVSAIDNMVNSFSLNPLSTAVKSAIMSGGTLWQYKDSTGQIDINNFRAMNCICVYDAGIIGDAYLDDGSLNPNPTDDLAAFEALVAKVANKVDGAHIWIPDGCHMYMSDELRVEYNTDNFTGDFDSENRRFAQLVIEGANKSGSSFIFAETSVNGVILNSKGFDTDTVSLTSIMLKNVGIRKINFDPYEYQARPWDEDFDFSGEPLYGAGLVQRFMGYTGGVYNVDIDGFYIGHLADRNYNGVADRIFARNTIYGYLGLENSVMNITNSRYRGLQSCFAGSNGSHVLSNVVCEGLSLQFNKAEFTDLYDNFAGHGIVHYGGRLFCNGNVYTESNPGLARDIKDCLYHEINGRLRSDIIFWYNNTMTQAFKDKVDVRNPKFKSIRITRTLDSIKHASIVDCHITKGERFSIVDKFLPDGSTLTPCLSVKGSLVLENTVKNTIDNYFLDLVPRDLEIVNYAPNTSVVPKISDSMQVINELEQLTDYDINFTVESGIKISRLNTRGNRLAKDTINATIDGNGTLRIKRQEYDTSGNKVVDELHVSLQKDGRLSTKNVFPLTDNTSNIGRADFRYRDVFLVNNPTVGSDERIKKDITSIPQELCDFVLNTEIKQYKLKDGQSGRYHYGIIVNQELLDNLNLIYSVDECAALCRTIFDNDVEIVDVVLGDIWQVRYAEWQNILLEAIRRKVL